MHRRRGNFFSRIRKLRWNSVTTAITVARVKYFNAVQSECLSFCDIDDGSLGHSGGIVFFCLSGKRVYGRVRRRSFVVFLPFVINRVLAPKNERNKK